MTILKIKIIVAAYNNSKLGNYCSTKITHNYNLTISNFNYN